VPTSNVTIDYWLECDGVRQSTYDTSCSGGTQARWISVDVQNKFSPMFTTRAWPNANSDGTITLHGKASLRTQ
jgi:hypothetical protein